MLATVKVWVHFWYTLYIYIYIIYYMRKATGSYHTYSISGKTAALDREFAVEDLSLAELQPRLLRLQWRTYPWAEHSDYIYISPRWCSWDLFRSSKVCSDTKKRKQREATASFQLLVKLQPWFLSLRWKTWLWAERIIIIERYGKNYNRPISYRPK